MTHAVVRGTRSQKLCGQDAANIVSIHEDLALALCRDNVVRILRTNKKEGNNATIAMMQRESLVIDRASATSDPSRTDQT